MLCIVPVCKTTNIRSHNQRPSILRHHNITHRTATGFCCVLVLGSIGVFLVICGILFNLVHCSPMRNNTNTVYSHEEHAVFCVHGTFQCRPLTSESTTWGVHLPSDIQLFSVGICTQPVNLFQDGISNNLLVCDGRVLLCQVITAVRRNS